MTSQSCMPSISFPGTCSFRRRSAIARTTTLRCRWVTGRRSHDRALMPCTWNFADLSGEEKVLEIGTGSGYQTALLSQLAAHVYSVETVQELAVLAADRLRDLGIENVTTRVGDGSAGWPEHAPYDVILCGAAAPRVPQPLVAQLGPGGRLLVPVGDDSGQHLVRVTLLADGTLSEEMVDSARFVPLTGEEGW